MDFRVKKVPRVKDLVQPQQRLRALVDRAPQAEDACRRMADRVRPVFDRVYGERRRIATGGVALLAVWLFIHVMFGANGMVVYRQKRAEYDDLQNQIKVLQDQNEQYGGRIKALQDDPQAIEKEARDQFHYARPGEVVYVNPASAPPPPPPPKTAKR
ncbi:MAG TPA: septum formation initiator family protein [Terriglobales bacterium]|nr:septum formation initiator family protein [Terriglobales bacterium]